jgi:hypothetical protein
LGQRDSVFAQRRELGIDASHRVLPLRLEFPDLAVDAGQCGGKGLRRVADGHSGVLFGLPGALAEYYDRGSDGRPYYKDDGG